MDAASGAGASPPKPDCALCSPALAPILSDGLHWRLVFNSNQDLLGKCFLAARRHVESATQLRAEEWLELHALLKRATTMLAAAFVPDHFNYAFLQNQDRHVHLHIIPRYQAPRQFAGSMFAAPVYPGHYAVPGKPRQLTAEMTAALVDHLRAANARATI